MRVVIIGGGITGLAAAHRVVELAGERGQAVEVRLLEAGERVGGVIETERREGFLLEAGPDSFITDKPWAMQLCRRIGMGERLIGTNSEFRRSYVVRGGRLHPVPEGFQLLAPSRFWPLVTSGIFSWPGKLRMALDLVIPPRRGDDDESVASFVERRLGREALTRMAQPMIAGIYGADPRLLSLEATIPRFREMERKHGSLIRAMVASRRAGVQVFRSSGVQEGNDQRPTPNAQRQEPVPQPPTPNTQYPTPKEGVSGARYGLFVSFDEGMQLLIDTLSAHLPAGAITLGARVTGLQRRDIRPTTNDQRPTTGDASRRPNTSTPQHPNTPTPEYPWRVFLASGEVLEADGVCIALPAYRAAALVEGVDAELAARLLEIPYASSATVNLAYRREEVPHPLNGFGFVVPAQEGFTLLGCTFSSVKWPGRAPEGRALLRAFLGVPHAGELTDEEIEAAVRDDLHMLLGIGAAPEWISIRRHPNAMAHYTVGHLNRVAQIEARVAALPGLALAGNAYRGIGIPDCVRGAEAAAERLMAAG